MSTLLDSADATPTAAGLPVGDTGTVKETVAHVWRLDDARQTLVLTATRERLPQVVHWGARLPDGEDLVALHDAHKIDVTGGMLDGRFEVSLSSWVITEDKSRHFEFF